MSILSPDAQQQPQQQQQQSPPVPSIVVLPPILSSLSLATDSLQVTDQAQQQVKQTPQKPSRPLPTPPSPSEKSKLLLISTSHTLPHPTTDAVSEPTSTNSRSYKTLPHKDDSFDSPASMPPLSHSFSTSPFPQFPSSPNSAPIDGPIGNQLLSDSPPSESSAIPCPPEIPLVAKHSKNQAFHTLFKHLPIDEFLIEDFSCALQKEILVQGRMYLTERHICFHAVIFGWVTSVQIAFKDVILIEKRVTALIFPNAIEVHTAKHRYFFASFIFRELAFNLLCSLWNKDRSEMSLPQHAFHPDKPHGEYTKKTNGDSPKRRLFSFSSNGQRSPRSNSTNPIMLGPRPISPSSRSKSGLHQHSKSMDTGGLRRRGSSRFQFQQQHLQSSSQDLVNEGSVNEEDGDPGWDLHDNYFTNASTYIPSQSSTKTATGTRHASNPAEHVDSERLFVPLKGACPRSLSASPIHMLGDVQRSAQSLRMAASSDFATQSTFPLTSNQPTFECAEQDPLPGLSGECTCTHFPEIVLEEQWQGMIPSQAFHFLFERGSPVVHQILVEKMLCTQIESADWTNHLHKDPVAGAQRVVSYTMPLVLPVSIPGAPKATRVQSRDEIVKYSSTEIVVSTVTETPDVPHGTSFSVHTLVCLRHAPHLKTTSIKVSACVKWSKSVWMLKSIIESNALEGQKNYWRNVTSIIVSQYADVPQSNTKFGGGPGVSSTVVDTPIDPVRDAKSLPASPVANKMQNVPSFPRSESKQAFDRLGSVTSQQLQQRPLSLVEKSHLLLLIMLVVFNVVVFIHLSMIHSTLSQLVTQDSSSLLADRIVAAAEDMIVVQAANDIQPRVEIIGAKEQEDLQAVWNPIQPVVQIGPEHHHGDVQAASDSFQPGTNDAGGLGGVQAADNVGSRV